MKITTNKHIFNIGLSKAFPYIISFEYVKKRGLMFVVKQMQLKSWWDDEIETAFIKWYNYNNKSYEIKGVHNV